MIFNAVKKVFGSRNDRLIKKHRKTVVLINALEAEFEALNDGQLAEKTDSLSVA
jgi:preprotein translocase subunit SecA